MKRRGLVGLLVLVSLALPLGAIFAAQGEQSTVAGNGDWIVLGDSAVVGDGQTVGGNVIVIGGDLRVEEGGQVSGDMVAIGGSVELAGRVDGDVVTVGASLQVDEGAQIGGETVVVGGDVDVAEGADLAGGFVTTPGPNFATTTLPQILRGFSVPRLPLTRLPLPRRAAMPVSEVANRLVTALSNAAILGVLSALVLFLWPTPLTRIGQAVSRAPAAASGVGCLSMVLFPLLGAAFVITLVLSPLAVLLVLVFLAVLLFGWVAIGELFGERLLEWLDTGEATPRNAGIVGTFVLTLLVGLVGALPGLSMLGLLAGLLLATVGVGAVVLTRFGGQTYEPSPAVTGEAQPPAPTPETTSPRGPEAEATKIDK